MSDNFLDDIPKIRQEPQSSRSTIRPVTDENADEFLRPQREVITDLGDVLDSLERVRSFLVKSETNKERNKEIKKVFDSILNDHSNKLQVFLVALGQDRVNRIAQILKDIDHLEDSLLGSDLATVAFEQRTNLYKAMTAREKQLIDFVQSVITSGAPSEYSIPSYVDDVKNDLRDGGVDIPDVQGRKSIMGLAEKLLKRARDRAGMEAGEDG